MTVFGFNLPMLLAAASPAPAATALSNQNRAPVQPVTPYLPSPLALDHPWVTHTLAGIFVFLAVMLVVLLAFQTTKQEGLSGTIGGRVESAYRPRLGFDQQLARTTSWVAIAFVFFGFLVSLSGI